jgi:4-diphosphocytidyl-2-C-methyl-D-erythritol kinase
MIAFPHCKINLGLRVINKREDGYHNIETCFFPVPWKDILEIIPSKDVSLSLTGSEVPGDANSNIVLKAYNLLKKDFPIGPVEIHLHKIIPTGAGLGGGSSDGAHALKILNSLFSVNLSKEKLKGYALQLGSDCPFFLEAMPMLATGRGEELSPLSVNLAGYVLAIVKPNFHVSTAEAFAKLSLTHGTRTTPLKELIQSPVKNWKATLKNDFEDSVFETHPGIADVKEKLYALGAVYASMTGSGSAVFGLFDGDINIEKEFSGIICWKGSL